MKYNSILSVLSIAVILGPVSQAKAGLVNGSFETGDYTGWTLIKDSGDPGDGTWGIAGTGQIIKINDKTWDFSDEQLVKQLSQGLPETYNPTDGQLLAYQIQNASATHRMYQDVILDSGSQILSWDMSYNNLFEDFSANQFLIVQIFDILDNYRPNTLFKTNKGDSLKIPMTKFKADISDFAGKPIRLDVTMQVREYYLDAAFDNFKINTVPESGTLALMSLGLAGLQFSRRKIRARA